MALKPVADRVIVKYFETEDKTASGIVLPDSSKEKTQQAEVIAVGSGKIVDGKEVPIQVKPGDRVIYGKTQELRSNTKVRNIWSSMPMILLPL